MMKSKLIALALCVSVGVASEARTVVDYFTSAKANDAIPLLNRNTRLDMYDYFSHDLPHVSANAMDGAARIVSVDGNDMTFEITSDVPCRLSMLTAGRDTVLMLVETLHLPQADSRISFYDKTWQPLKREVFAEPKLADWLTSVGKAERDDVEAWLPFLLWRADYQNDVLTLTSTLDKYYADPKDLTQLSRWLLPSLTYTYNGKKFVRKK